MGVPTHDFSSGDHASLSPRLLTSNLLRQALTKPEATAAIFKYSQGAAAAESLSVRAIARAISHHQRAVYGTDDAPDKYKDRVRRALSGESLSPDTLNLFAETFNFPKEVHQQLLTQLSEESAFASTSLAWLFEYPQVAVLSAYIDVALCGNANKNHCITITATLSALEQGASSFVLFVPDSTGHIDQLEGCSAVKITDEGHWLISLDFPLKPLMHTLIRLSIEVSSSDKKSHLEVPLWGKYCSVALSIKAPSPELDIAIETLALTSNSNTRLYDGVQVDGYYSVYCAVLENISLRVDWGKN